MLYLIMIEISTNVFLDYEFQLRVLVKMVEDSGEMIVNLIKFVYLMEWDHIYAYVEMMIEIVMCRINHLFQNDESK